MILYLSSSPSTCVSEVISINSMEASSACDFMPKAQPNMENYSNIQKRMFTLLQPLPGIIRQNLSSVGHRRERIFSDLHRKSSDYLPSFAQDECKHTRMAGICFSGKEKNYFHMKWTWRKLRKSVK
jgi:hypothetical protein